MRLAVFVMYGLFWVYAWFSCMYPELRPLPVMIGIALHIVVVCVARANPFKINFAFITQNEDLIAGMLVISLLIGIVLAFASSNPFLILAAFCAGNGFGIGLAFEN